MEKKLTIKTHSTENKPEMVNKQEFIEKACKIYRKHLMYWMSM